jgi:hypothetical protein
VAQTSGTTEQATGYPTWRDGVEAAKRKRRPEGEW